MENDMRSNLGILALAMAMSGNNYDGLELPRTEKKKKRPEKIITSTAAKRANGKRKSLKRRKR